MFTYHQCAPSVYRCSSSSRRWGRRRILPSPLHLQCRSEVKHKFQLSLQWADKNVFNSQQRSRKAVLLEHLSALTHMEGETEWGSRSTVRQRVRQIMSPCCAHRIHASFWKPKIRFTHAISASLRAAQDVLFVTRWKDKLQNVHRVTREMPVK